MEIGPITAVPLVPAVRPAPKITPGARVRVEYSERAEDEADFTDSRGSKRGGEDEEEPEEAMVELDRSEAEAVNELPTISFFA